MDGVALTLEPAKVDKSGDARGRERTGGDVRLFVEEEERDPVLGLGQVIGDVV